MLILDILEEYSDEDHKLTQQEIIRLLKLNYDMDCDRRSVKNNVLFLKELGYEISIEDGYYLMEREFDDAELLMLIDSVLFSKNLTQNQAKTLIEKLKNMGNRYFSEKVDYVRSLPELHHGDNKQLMYVLDTISKAISQEKKISFIYNSYDADLKLHPKRKEKYIVSPYQMVFNHGFHYLIGNYDNYDDISHFRLDRMTYVEILPEKVKSQSQVIGLAEQRLNLSKYMEEHIYMFSGESITINILVDENLINELIDWFGKKFHVLGNKQDGQILVSLKCNERAFFYWALQYGPYVEVVKPMTLRNKIADAVKSMNEKYHKER